MLRNTSGQKWRVYAWDTTTGQAKTGDAANISAILTKDFGTPAATDDAAPTEVDATNEPGYYEFTLLQTESDAHTVSLSPQSSTANIAVVACPPVQNPIPQYLSLLGIESDGDLTKVNTLDGHTAQTGDSYARLGAPAGASIAADIATVDTVADGIKAVTDNLPDSGALTSLAQGTDLATVDANVDAILEDTATTIPAAIDNLNDLDSTAVQSAAAAALTAYDPPTKAELDAGLAALNDLDAADIRAAMGLATANLDVQLATIDSVADAILVDTETTIPGLISGLNDFDPANDTVANVTTVGSVTTTTGYKLASDGLDSIAVTRPSGKATTFPAMIVQLFYRFFGKTTLTSNTLTTYAADGSTAVTEQTVSDDGTTQIQGEASDAA